MYRATQLLIPLLALTLTGCALSGKTTTHATLSDEVENAWVTAFNARDNKALQALYAEDCVLLPPNSPSVKGRAAAIALFAEGMRQGLRAREVHAESKVVGDLAYRYGTYQTDDASGREIDHGNYFEIWRKGDDGWKLSRDIWNSTMPLTTPDDPAQRQ